jgi:hypothetical protein
VITEGEGVFTVIGTVTELPLPFILSEFTGAATQTEFAAGLETVHVLLKFVPAVTGKLANVNPEGRSNLTLPTFVLLPEVIVKVMDLELPAQIGVDVMLTVCPKTTFTSNIRAKVSVTETIFEFRKNVLMQYVLQGEAKGRR